VAKVQYKIRIEEALVAKLSELGARCGYSSGNEFAAAALSEYADLLADLLTELQAGRREMLAQQREQLLGKASATIQSPSRRRKPRDQPD
jgi:hypothetical protein